jgi:hypothetical protein
MRSIYRSDATHSTTPIFSFTFSHSRPAITIHHAGHGKADGIPGQSLAMFHRRAEGNIDSNYLIARPQAVITASPKYH